MKKVVIYTTDTCGYCGRAKRILAGEGVPYEERNVTDDDAQRAWLVQATGRRTVPQIFFNDEPIGGCDDLEAIVKQGKLKERLGASPSP